MPSNELSTSIYGLVTCDLFPRSHNSILHASEKGTSDFFAFHDIHIVRHSPDLHPPMHLGLCCYALSLSALFPRRFHSELFASEICLSIVQDCPSRQFLQFASNALKYRESPSMIPTSHAKDEARCSRLCGLSRRSILGRQLIYG
jgi:hypothetical protein